METKQVRSIEILYPGKVFAQSYRLQARLGGNEISDVWLAEQAGTPWVLKVFLLPEPLSEAQWKRCNAQLAQLQAVKHNLILSPKEWGLREGMPYVVTPYCQYGNARRWVGKLSESELATLLFQAGAALEKLHTLDPPLLHRDLHPNNFLIDQDLNYVLGDTFLSGYLRHIFLEGEESLEGNFAYQAPECFLNEQYGRPADIFSLGISMFEIATGRLPFGDKGGKKLLEGGRIPNLPDTYSHRLNQIIQVCLSRSPEGRPDAKTIHRLAQSYLDEANWKSVPGFSFPSRGKSASRKRRKARLKFLKKEGMAVRMPRLNRTLSLVVASLALGIGLAIFLILPFFRAAGLEKWLSLSHEPASSERLLAKPESEPIAQSLEYLSDSPVLDTLKMSTPEPAISVEEPVSRGEIPPPPAPEKPLVLPSEAESTPRPVQIDNEGLPDFLGNQNILRQAVEKLKNSEGKLSEAERYYVEQIEAELALLDQETQRRISFPLENLAESSWKPSQKSEGWLRQMNASLSQHLRNLDPVLSRLEPQ